MTSSPDLSKSKDSKSSPQNTSKPVKETEPVSWFNRIDYVKIAKQNGLFFWQNWRKILPICLLLLITGGQVVSRNFSPGSGNWQSNNSNTNQSENDAPVGANDYSPLQNSGDWMNTLRDIENQESQKMQIRDFIEKNKDNQKYFIYGGLAIVLVIILGIIVTLCLNSYYHLLLIYSLKNLPFDQSEKKLLLKEQAHKGWRRLVWLRVIFGLISLVSLLLFLSPAGLFALQESWILAGTLFFLGLLTSAVAFFIINYVFRFSFFYLILSGISLKKSIDNGYDLFVKYWKESLLTSFATFVLQIIFLTISTLAIILSGLAVLLIGGVFWLLIYLLLGQTHPWEIAIGLGSIFALGFLAFLLVVFSLWSGYLVAFWLAVFEELAGCKKELAETVPKVIKILKEAPKGVNRSTKEEKVL